MGGRGAFEDVSAGNFQFVVNGQTYKSVGNVDGVEILLRTRGAVKAPEYSHSPGRAYAIVQNGVLKHLTFYDNEHKQTVSIDLQHAHHGVQPHKHLNLDHSDVGIPISKEDAVLIKKICRRFNLK